MTEKFSHFRNLAKFAVAAFVLAAAFLIAPALPASASVEDEDYLHPGPTALGVGLKTGHLTEAQLNEAVRKNPKSADAYLARGNGYLGSAEIDKAMADFDKAIQLDPKCGKAHIGRYFVYYGRKNAQAIAELKMVEKIGPPDLAMDAVNLEATYHFDSGKMQEALAEYTRVINSNLFSKKRLAFVYLRRGVVYDRLFKTLPAISDFTSSIKLNRNQGLAYLYRANDYRRLRNYKGAIADYNYVEACTEHVAEEKRDVDMEEARSELYRYRADYFKEIHRPGLAARDLKKLEAVDREDIEASPFQLK